MEYREESREQSKDISRMRVGVGEKRSTHVVVCGVES